MSYDISDTWRDDFGRPRQPWFSDPCAANRDTTPPTTTTASVDELHRLCEENRQLKEELRQACEQNTRLRALIDHRPERDTATLDDAAHATLADRFRDLVQQDMQHVARQLLRNQTDRDATHQVALCISAVCQALLIDQRNTTQTCLLLGVDPDIRRGTRLPDQQPDIRAPTRLHRAQTSMAQMIVILQIQAARFSEQVGAAPRCPWVSYGDRCARSGGCARQGRGHPSRSFRPRCAR